MKGLVKPAKVLSLVAATAVVVLFAFFAFVSGKVGTSTFDLTGFQIAFGSEQTIAGSTLATYKGLWYTLLFFISVLSVVFSAFGLKKKGSLWAAICFNIASAIGLGVLQFNSLAKYVDTGAIKNVTLSVEPMFLVAFIIAIVAVILSIAALLITDYVEVMDSKGAKKTIFAKIKLFIRDYKSELKKIVWPSRQTVTKNFLVVIAMCAIVGAYIWVVDFGLAELLQLIFGK